MQPQDACALEVQLAVLTIDSMNPDRCRRPDAPIRSGSKRADIVAYQAFATRQRGDLFVPKAVQAILRADPDVMFPVLQQTPHGIRGQARQTARTSRSPLHPREALVNRASPCPRVPIHVIPLPSRKTVWTLRVLLDVRIRLNVCSSFTGWLTPSALVSQMVWLASSLNQNLPSATFTRRPPESPGSRRTTPLPVTEPD